MPNRLFTKEVLLDVSVNLIPLGIILAFSTLYLLGTPWEIMGFPIALAQFLPILIGLIGLSVLTYIGAAKIET